MSLCKKYEKSCVFSSSFHNIFKQFMIYLEIMDFCAHPGAKTSQMTELLFETDRV